MALIAAHLNAKSFWWWQCSIKYKISPHPPPPFVSRFGLAVRCYRLVSGRTSVRYRFGSPFSSKRLWFVDIVLWLCPSLPTETWKWLSSPPILTQESFWWWQCSDRYIISLFPHRHTPFSPSLISLVVSVDIVLQKDLCTIVIITVFVVVCFIIAWAVMFTIIKQNAYLCL